MSSGLKMLIFENLVEISRRKLDKQVCSSEAGSGLETDIWGSSGGSCENKRADPVFYG